MLLDYIMDCWGFVEVLYILANGNSMYLYIYMYIYSTRYKGPFNLRVWWRTCWLSKWGYKTETFLLTTPIFLEPGKERLRKRSFLPLLISSHMPHFLSSHSSLFFFFFFFFFLRDIGHFNLEHWLLLISYYTHAKTSSLVCQSCS